MQWGIKYTKQAAKDGRINNKSSLKEKQKEIIKILAVNPFQNPPPYEKLVGSLRGFYSRRLNDQHRIVYQVLKDERIVKIVRMRTHYGE